MHHAVEQQVLKHYPKLVKPEELNSLENLRGIKKGGINNEIHLSALRKEWNQFYRSHLRATKQELLDFVTILDAKYGKSFTPPRA